MFLSKRSNGVYYLWYTDDLGKKHKVTTGERLKSGALNFLQQFRQQQAESAKRWNHKLLSEFIQDFLPYAEGNYSHRTVIIYKAVLKRLQAFAGDCRVVSISPQHIDTFKTERLRQVSPVSVNIELRTLRAAFNTAVRWNIIGANPLSKMQLVTVPEQSPSFFTKTDFQKLISVIREKWLREMVMLAAFTGMRKGEIVNLSWDTIDMQRKLIHIQTSPTFRTKQGKRRTIPLSDVAFLLLQAQHGKSTSEYVFTSNDARISESWVSHRFKYYVREARLTNAKLHFHSLRHTFASWLVQDGVSLYEVQKLLGHSNIAVTQVYSHLQPETLHSTVNKISISFN
ncbi:MAG TPA: tyrosine-type recombinase/integrase [Bacteroidota bacterium]|jgi:integrase